MSGKCNYWGTYRKLSCQWLLKIIFVVIIARMYHGSIYCDSTETIYHAIEKYKTKLAITHHRCRLTLADVLLSGETMVWAVFKAVNTSLGKNYGDPGLPNHQNPPLSFTNEIQRNVSNTFGISSAAGAVDKTSRVTPNNFRSSIPGLLLGFAPFYHLPIKAIECDLPF